MSAPARLLPLARDRWIVLASLVGMTALAWLCLIDMADGMNRTAMGDMAGVAMPAEAAALAPMSGRFAIAAVMWAVMMAGMMLPSAMPMILLFAAVQRSRAGRPAPMSALFAAGYLLVWGGFALAAAALQLALQRRSLLSPALALADARVTAAAFLLAGAFEFSALKNRCLARCRAPFAFVVRHWRPGATSAVAMGARHGGFCLGCCWALMLLLFAAGVMNLLWVAALSGLVLLQKVLPGGRAVSAATGLAMLGVGAWLL
jgi:predicted metal-binding membrane protein